MFHALFKIKDGVNIEGVHPLVWGWAGVAARLFFEKTGSVQTLTSVRRPYREGSTSKHAPPPGKLVTAWDGRRHELDAMDGVDPTRRTAELYCSELQRRFGLCVGVVLEPEWLTVRDLEKRFGIQIHDREQEKAARRRVVPHIHHQLKGRIWTAG